MKKVIEVDIFYEADLIERYNKKEVSKDLINYLVDNVYHLKSKDKIRIKVNNEFKQYDSIKLIKNGLKDEYEKAINEYYRTNFRQAIYLIIGVIMLFLARIIGNSLLSEIISIGGWVFIWSLIELEIFADVAGRKRRKALKKLLNSDICEI